MSVRCLVILGAVLSGLELLAPGAAVAQNAPATAQATPASLQEVVVTAERRQENLVDVPISVTTINNQQLTTVNVQNLSDIQQLTPGLRFSNQTGFFQPSIRGIGTLITTSGGGTNVGTYIDGFYDPNPQAINFQLLGITSVQVLKGPQGTLFGHNSTGGAILVSTAEPSQDFGAQARVNYGSFDAQRVQAYVTGGLFGGLAGDLQGIFSKGNGFITNIYDNNRDVGAYENWTIRMGLKYVFSNGVSVLLRYMHQREDDPTTELTNSNTDTSIDPTTGRPFGIQTLTVPGTYTTNPDQVALHLPVFVRSNNDVAQLTVKADLGFAELTSYTQWRQEDTDQSENLGQVAVPTFQLGLPIFDSTKTQEFLLTSKPGGRLQWTTGVFLMSNLDSWVTLIDNYVNTPPSQIPPGLPPLWKGNRVPFGGSGTTTNNYSYYLDATYALIPDRLFFTLGARFSHDEVTNAYWNTPFIRTRNYEPDISSNRVTPRAVIRYKVTDHSDVYASFSEGYKAAIIDVGGSCQDSFTHFTCNPIQPETVYAYEVGYKLQTPIISNQFALFDYQYKNLQVSEFLGNAQAFIVNAAQSRIYGAEDDLQLNLQDHFTLNAGVSYVHARYTTFGNSTVGAPLYATCPIPFSAPPPGCAQSLLYVNTNSILHNVPMQTTPDWTASFGPRYTTGMTPSGEYSLSANAYFVSRLYFSPSGTQFAQPSFTTVALRGQWQDPSDHYTVAVYGNNLTNTRYRTQVQYNGFGIGASWSAPPTWGIELGYKY